MIRLPFCVASESTSRRAVDLSDGSGTTISFSSIADAAELDLEALEPVGTAELLRVRPCDLRHRVQAVQDPAGQPDLPGELLVDVDRVEVARCAGVADGHIAVRGDLELELIALGSSLALTMLVQVPVQTVSARWLAETVSNTKNFNPPRSACP